MEMEAHNLSKFNVLMTGYDSVKFPTPLYPFVTKTVLVESYEVIWYFKLHVHILLCLD